MLERKIQLLERKGWFEGVEHRREALDRLLPTIRAAADPITRELYLKEVSERTGVSREVLLQQVTARPSPACRVPRSAPLVERRSRRACDVAGRPGRPAHRARAPVARAGSARPSASCSAC